MCRDEAQSGEGQEGGRRGISDVSEGLALALPFTEIGRNAEVGGFGGKIKFTFRHGKLQILNRHLVRDVM